MSAFLWKEKVLAELDTAIVLCKTHDIPTPNLERIKQHVLEGRMDWSGEGD